MVDLSPLPGGPAASTTRTTTSGRSSSRSSASSFPKPRTGSVRVLRGQSVRSQITLADVTGSPLEDEAETAIIRALEKRDWEQNGGACDGVDSARQEDAVFREALEAAVRSKRNLVGGRGTADAALLTDATDDADVDDAARQGEAVSSGKQNAISRWNMARMAVNTTTQLQTVQKTEAVTAAAQDGDRGGEDEDGDGKDEGDGDEYGGGSMEGPTGDGGAKGRRGGKMTGVGVALHRFARDTQNIAEDASGGLHFKFYRRATLYLILPGLVISAILFYAAGNPMPNSTFDVELDKLKDAIGQGANSTKEESSEEIVVGMYGPSGSASYSWWFNFGIRQILTLSLSRLTETLVVDILALRTDKFPRLLGPWLTLTIIQSKGWPFLLIFWAVWDFAILQGKTVFARHWLYYIGVSWFSDCATTAVGTECNPAGNVVGSDNYFRFLISLLVAGVVYALKRVGTALYNERRSCGRYGPELEKLTKKMTLISEVAHLAKEIEVLQDGYHLVMSPSLPTSPVSSWDKLKQMKKHDDSEDDFDEEEEEEESQSTKGVQSLHEGSANVSMSTQEGAAKERFGHQVRMHLDHSERMKIADLLGEWDEPVTTRMVGNRLKEISIDDLLHYRQAVMCLDVKHPFSYDFGQAWARERCIDSSQEVYDRLLLHTPEQSSLPFETIALVTLMSDGEIDRKKARRLMRLFRPDRNGYLTTLDFVKSCDTVYKEMRTLSAGIANSSQIDRAFTQIVNFVFGIVLLCVILAIWKIDPLKLLISLSSFFLSFSFLIKGAASKWIEGVLLVLVQQPYDIGDKIALSNPQTDTKPTGSSGWFVEKVTLYYTTVRFGTTNEMATYANGSLASSKIINAARSPKANVCIYNRFMASVPYERVMVFKSVVESFVKERPREWHAINAFRATTVEADLGYIEYVIVLQHAEGWQNTGAILNSKAEVSSYCLEVQKKLGMRYCAPPLPVNLDYDDEAGIEVAKLAQQMGGMSK